MHTSTNFNWDRTDTDADPGRSIYQELEPTDPFIPSPTPTTQPRDVFVQFDGWGRLATQSDATLSNFGQSGDNWAYQRSFTQDYTYDALGRRITEAGTDSTGTQTTHLYYDANGNIIEDQLQVGTSTPTTQDQYVFSAADPSMMVLRDRDDDSNSSTGNFGKTGSGLEQRVWVMQGPDGSVWRIREQGGDSLAFEQYLYDSQGKATIIHRNSNTQGDYVVGLPNSEFSWQNFWRDGRATIVSAPQDPNDLSDMTNIQTYDGLIYFPGGGEYDTLTGAPVAEDVYAYVRSNNAYNSATAENTDLPDNGTTDAFVHPVGGEIDSISNVGALSFGSGGVANGTMNMSVDLSYSTGPAQLPPQAGLTVQGGVGLLPGLSSMFTQNWTAAQYQAFNQMNAQMIANADRQTQGPQLWAPAAPQPITVGRVASDLGNILLDWVHEAGPDIAAGIVGLSGESYTGPGPSPMNQVTEYVGREPANMISIKAEFGAQAEEMRLESQMRWSPAQGMAASAAIPKYASQVQVGDYLAAKAPMQVQPGVRVLAGQYIESSGVAPRVQPWTAFYDEYGRIIARTDYNAGNPAAGIPDTHHTTYGYNNGIPYVSQNHVPGVYQP